jgi:outer membrane receptor protein involved in Fe transport
MHARYFRSALLASITLLPTVAVAQTAPSDQKAQAAQADAKSDEASRIVVTGSRIARPDLKSAMPVAVLRMDSAKSFGYNTVYDALKLIPAVAPGLGNSNAQGETFDVGVANINLRNLGVNRSLVLVDGKRWVSGGARTSAVDLNTIPDAMIERFEVVTGGAAAIYGADAVTGAVNIIMKKSITGLHLTATNGISQDGDARESNFSATTGFKFSGGRGSFVVGGTYNYSAPLRYTDRWTNRTVYRPNPASTGPNDGVPDNILENNLRLLNRAASPTIFYNNQWYILQNGVLSPTAYDYVIVPGLTGTGSGGPGANAFENHFLRNKSQNASAYSHVGYELTPALTWNATFDYAHSYTRGPTVFPEVRTDARPKNWWGGTTGEIATLTNPYLPASLRQFMVANGLTSIPLNRSYFNLPQAFEIHKRDSFTAGTDIGGELTDKLNWTAFFQYGQVVDNVTTTNMIRHFAWLNARNVIADPVTGQPVCADAAARAAGCVPFNFFSTDRPSDAFLNYVEANRYERRKNALYTAGGNITGSIFSLPYGDVSIAAGAEWRRETLSTRDDPDAAKLADIIFRPGGDYVLHPNLDAARNTTEVYGELVVPLLKDLPLVRRLEIEGAYRYSDYSDTPSTSTWKVGGTWEPLAGLTMRGVYSHSVRVPNFGELYSPLLIQTVGVTNDPCSGVFITQNPNRAANCAAVLPGLTLPLPFPNTNAPMINLGGNPGLTPEKSNSLTLGAVLQPRFLPGFDMTVDYWDIKIDNVITAVPYLSILNLCVDSPSGPDPFYCGLISRNAAGQIVTIQAANYNQAALGARGIDIGLNYRRDVGPGQLQLGFNGTYLLKQLSVATSGTAGVDFAGQWNFPRFKATLMTNYSVGKFTLGLNTRFISRSIYAVTDASPETRSPNHVPAYVYNDVTVQFRPAEKYNLTLGVRNISNVGVFAPLRDTGPGPNSSGGVQTGSAYYDAIGRYFFAKVGVNF